MNKHFATLRPLDGMLLLDKPKGLSSNTALQNVKRLYKARKAGHAGSLDPLATGMLLICFGEATKFSQFLLEADKVYEVCAKLGIETTTGDAEGEIIAEKSPPPIDRPCLEELFSQFTGKVVQTPSMYSALKHKGQPLYKLARSGIEVPRTPREVTVYNIQYLKHTHDTFSIRMVCTKGTYVRTLVADMGKVLGCGAHVLDLHRQQVGPYHAEDMHRFDHLEHLAKAVTRSDLDACLLPIETALPHLPQLTLSQAAIYYLKRGQHIIIPDAPASGCVRIHRKNGQFLGICTVLKDGKLAPRRLIANI